jgi:hypothetical protein
MTSGFLSHSHLRPLPGVYGPGVVTFHRGRSVELFGIDSQICRAAKSVFLKISDLNREASPVFPALRSLRTFASRTSICRESAQSWSFLRNSSDALLRL